MEWERKPPSDSSSVNDNVKKEELQALDDSYRHRKQEYTSLFSFVVFQLRL